MATADLLVRVRSDTGSASKDLGGIGAKVAGFGRTAVKVGAAAAASLAGTVLWAGFRRLTDIDNATAKLTGLGHSTKSVERIMGNALAAVKGTSFGLGEAASVAASAVAAGVRPGKDLERTLKLVADAATIAGTDMGSMGSIFNKVAADNKIQGEEIAQLSDRGIPIIQMLAKELGVTAQKASEMASKGAIGFNTFRNAMEKGLGGAALESGKTFSGALKNVYAALGRVGAAILGGAFSKMPALFQKVIEWIDKVTPAAQRVGEAFGQYFTRAVDAVSGLLRFLTKYSDVIVPLVAGVLAMVAAMRTYAIVVGIMTAAQTVLNAVMAANPFGILALALIGLAAAFVTAYKKSETFRNIVNGVLGVVKAAWAGTFNAAKTIVTTAMTAINAAINTIRTFMTNVGTAIRNIWTGAWNNIKQGATGVKQDLTAKFNAAKESIRNAFTAVRDWWNERARNIKERGTDVKEDLSQKFNAAKENIKTAFTAVKNWWGERVADIKTKAGEAKTDLNSKFEGVKTTVSGYFTTIKSNWETALTNIKGAVAGVGEVLSKPFSAVKGAIDSAVSAVKSLISWLGKIKIPKIKLPGGLGKALTGPPPTNPNSRSVSFLTARAPVVSLPASARAASTGAGSGGGGIHITVNGAIDPEATARQIRRILANHDRRMGYAS